VYMLALASTGMLKESATCITTRNYVSAGFFSLLGACGHFPRLFAGKLQRGTHLLLAQSVKQQTRVANILHIYK
jgi:hypothetical protein